MDNRWPLVDDADAMAAQYAYELWSGENIFATGRLVVEHDFERGDEVRVAGIVARVKDVSWANGEPRLILQPTSGLLPG